MMEAPPCVIITKLRLADDCTKLRLHGFITLPRGYTLHIVGQEISNRIGRYWNLHS